VLSNTYTPTPWYSRNMDGCNIRFMWRLLMLVDWLISAIIPLSSSNNSFFPSRVLWYRQHEYPREWELELIGIRILQPTIQIYFLEHPYTLWVVSCEGTVDNRSRYGGPINIHHFHVSIIVEMVDIDEDGARRHYYRMRDMYLARQLLTTRSDNI